MTKPGFVGEGSAGGYVVTAFASALHAGFLTLQAVCEVVVQGNLRDLGTARLEVGLLTSLGLWPSVSLLAKKTV